MVPSSLRKKRSFTKLFRTSSPLHRQRQRPLPLPSLRRMVKVLFRVDRRKVRRSQAPHNLRQVKLHNKARLVNHLNTVCQARSPQWANDRPTALILSIKDPARNRRWLKRSRQLCLVRKLSGKVHQCLLIIQVSLHTKEWHPDPARTHSHNRHNSKGCNLQQDSNRHLTLAPISRRHRKCRHQDRHSLHRRKHHRPQQHRQPRIRPRILPRRDPLALLQLNRRSRLLCRRQISQLNKPLCLSNNHLRPSSNRPRRHQWLKPRLSLNLPLQSNNLQLPHRHNHQLPLLWHSNKPLRPHLQPLHQLQWLLLRRNSHQRRLQLHPHRHLQIRRHPQIQTHMEDSSDLLRLTTTATTKPRSKKRMSSKSRDCLVDQKYSST